VVDHLNSSMPAGEVLPAEIVQLDSDLHALVKDIDILDAVAPLNYKEEKALFLKAHYSHEPNFIYAKKNLDAFAFKRSLFQLPIEKVQDEDLRTIYLAVIDSYVDKVDQYKSIGSPDFLYDSLRYYGEPSEKDLRNANFILHLPKSPDREEELLDANRISQVLAEFADREGYTYTTKIDGNMIAKALVSGTTVKINSNAEVGTMEVMALAHHELGVHLLTTLNGKAQPLKILSVGCPVNTMTQEGLAILSEHFAGCLSIERLKVLALRVIAVTSMIQDKNFRTTFLKLKEDHGVDDEFAFTITARVYRGGGFTKDYLYLQGFHQMLNAYEHEPHFLSLLAGKTSIDFLPQIQRLIHKGWLIPPTRITPAFAKAIVSDDLQKFIVHAIM
jgi:uncharacterized protein (TIGR02421 family)